MPYDTPGQRNVPALQNGVALLEPMMVQAVESANETALVKKAGRPNRLSNRLLAAGILWCLLHGWVSQWDLWRRVSCFGIGSLAPVADLGSGDLQSGSQARNGCDATAVCSDQYLALAVDGSL